MEEYIQHSPLIYTHTQLALGDRHCVLNGSDLEFNFLHQSSCLSKPQFPYLLLPGNDDIITVIIHKVIMTMRVC